jgi:hypothetical protein
MFCRRSRALSRETRTSSPARLRLSFPWRSSVCAPLTEGERTDVVASRWRRDDRGLDLVEVECAMPSSRSTSSCHCFMAPGEAVECHTRALRNKARCISYMRQEDNIYNNRVYRDKCHNSIRVFIT